MKKLMIAAFAAAAVGGVFAANCKPGETPDEQLDPWAYSWTFSGKTTTGVLVKGIAAKETGVCNPGTIPGTEDEYIRVPATLKIQGYTYQCNPECGSFGEWDKEAFVITKPAKDYFDGLGEAGNLGIAHVIGKKATQVEIGDTFDATTVDSGEEYSVVFAGLGTYNLKNVRVTSASGNFAGAKITPHALSVKGCPEAIYWTCDGSAYDNTDSWSVAYGKWSVKYSASAAKAYGKNGTVAKLPVVGKSY
jgi:hypothetical protein